MPLEPVTEPVDATPALLAQIDQAWTAADPASRDEAVTLAVLAHASAQIGGHILVVGAGQGQNAFALGVVARATRSGRVFAIDVFPEHDDSPDADGWSLDDFLHRASSADLAAWVLPHYGTATSFAQLMPADFQCRLIHLEGAHVFLSLATDLFLLERLLAPGGWLTIGAGLSGFPGAVEAIDTFRRQRPALTGWHVLTPGLLAAHKVP